MPQGGASWGLPQWMGETQFGQRDSGGREGPPPALPAPALRCAPPAWASVSCAGRGSRGLRGLIEGPTQRQPGHVGRGDSRSSQRCWI